MTDEFLKIITSPSVILDAVLDVMCFGKFEPDTVVIRKYRPFLAIVENFIRFYEDDVETQKMPVFLSYEQGEDAKKILVNYLATRQTLLNPITRNKITREATASFHTAVSSRRFRFNHSLSDRSGLMTLQDIEIQFCKYVYKRIYKNAELNEYIDKKDLDLPMSDLLMCRSGLRPQNKTDIVSKFFSKEGFNHEMALSFNTNKSADRFRNSDKGLKKIPKGRMLQGNGFMIYTHADCGRFSPGQLSVMSGTDGYDIANMFVFVLVDKALTLGSLARYSKKLFNEYGMKPFFLDADESKYIIGKVPAERKQIIVGAEEDYLTLSGEIRYILGGCDGLRHSIRNILALCCDHTFEGEFVNILKRYGFDEPECDSLEIFDYLRSLWDQIVARVNEHASNHEAIAFVIEKLAYESDVLKSAIRRRFPGRKVSFYLLSDLRHSEKIKEHYIFQLRYWGFNEQYIIYPNSYDYTILDADKELVEIIPLVLFAPSVARSENAISAFYNKLQDIPYRKDCLGWQRRAISNLSMYTDEDDGNDYISQSHNDRISVKLVDGSNYIRVDGEEVLYKTDTSDYLYGKLIDLVDYKGTISMQFMDELEDYLSSIVDKVSKDDNAIESGIREKLIQDGKMDNIPDVEIWKAMLLKRVDTEGLEKVVSDLKPLIGHLYRNLERTITHSWLNFTSDSCKYLPSSKYVKKELFAYLGIPRYSPYPGIVQRRKATRTEESRRTRSLINQFIKSVLNLDIKDGVFDYLYGKISDSLDLLGITSDDNLRFIQHNLLNEGVDLRDLETIEKIVQYEE